MVEFILIFVVLPSLVAFPLSFHMKGGLKK